MSHGCDMIVVSFGRGQLLIAYVHIYIYNMFNAKSNNKSTYNKVKHLEQIHYVIDHIQQSPPTLLRN